jgi:hypothetical protein
MFVPFLTFVLLIYLMLDVAAPPRPFVLVGRRRKWRMVRG